MVASSNDRIVQCIWFTLDSFISDAFSHVTQYPKLPKISFCAELQQFEEDWKSWIFGLPSGKVPWQHYILVCYEVSRVSLVVNMISVNQQVLNLSGNKIRSMNGLQGHEYLESIDLEDNEVCIWLTLLSFGDIPPLISWCISFWPLQIIDLSEVQYIQKLLLLRQLNLQRNPIRELPDYRLSILFHVRKLTELDNRRVDVEEKVSPSILHESEHADMRTPSSMHLASKIWSKYLMGNLIFIGCSHQYVQPSTGSDCS